MSDRPAVRTIPNVELFTVGSWPAAGMPDGGLVPFTADDVASAVAAYDDPSYSTPVLKLGHTDPRFDGNPALGRIINPRASDDGQTFIADLAGVPTWLADLIDGQRLDPEGANAYPRRSVEGTFGYVTPTGRHHSFALTALSLLGDTLPAISTLADIATMYGMDPVEVAAAATTSLREDRVPQPVPVTAAVNLDAVRTAFYASEACREKFGAWSWVREVYTDHLIVDDDEGNLFRLPWTEADGQRVEFDTDTAQSVMVEYVDRPEAAADVAASAVGSLRAATAAHMRRPTTTPPSPAAAVAASGTPEQQEDTVDDSTLAALRAAVGITDDTADESTILAAVTEALNERAEPVTPETAPVVPDGFTLVDQDTLSELRTAASRGVEAHTRLMLQDRDGTIAAAVGDGRIARASVARWTERWDAEAKRSNGDAPDTRDLLAALPTGLVPVEAAGVTGGSIATADDEALYAGLFPDEVKN